MRNDAAAARAARGAARDRAPPAPPARPASRGATRRGRSTSICYYTAAAASALPALTVPHPADARARVRPAPAGRRRPGGDDPRPRARAPASCDGRARPAHRPHPLPTSCADGPHRPMDLEKCRYIVVEGPIGAGKTSLARQHRRRALARRRAARAARGQPVPRALLRGHGALRAADAAHVPVPARRPAARRRPVRHVPPRDRRRLPARQGPAVRAAQPVGRRVPALREGLLAPEAADADAGSRHLPAGAGRDAGRARAAARRRLRADDLAAVPRAARRRVQPLLLPVRGRAAADRQQRAAQFRRQCPSTSTLLLARIAIDARPARVLQPRRPDHERSVDTGHRDRRPPAATDAAGDCEDRRARGRRSRCSPPTTRASPRSATAPASTSCSSAIRSAW